VSRHLKLLGDDQWIVSRAEGTSRYYRRNPSLDDAARRLWDVVRHEVSSTAVAAEDTQRAIAVLANRRATSRAFFSAAANKWDAMRQELFGERQDAAVIAALASPDAVVGDLGCGTGNLTALLAPHVRRVIAVDGSAAMLDAARARAADARNVDWRVGDLESLPVEDAALDVALLSLVLHYVAEPPRVLAEAARTLVPGGRLVVMDMLPHAREEYREQMGHVWQGFSESQIRDWMTQAGFTGVRLHALGVDEKAKGPALFVATGTNAVRTAGRDGRTNDRNT
jgi:ArsR family transcriptional regulator